MKIKRTYQKKQIKVLFLAQVLKAIDEDTIEYIIKSMRFALLII
ncbi:hypothetical protein O8C97_06910 [Aliarcobacter butzleri]|nr:hypothetical protein [Aliarcobacter butzleri]